MIELNLNDFEGFNKILFGDHEHDWSKFYNKETRRFIPPIDSPATLAAHQLDHYALWMVISAFGLSHKPEYWDSERIPPMRCYACAWKLQTAQNCRDGCPLILDDDYEGCGSAYDRFESADKLEDLKEVREVRKQAAKEIAMLKWRWRERKKNGEA